MALRPVVFSGPSGSGKSTLLGLLFKEFPNEFGFSVSHTTRQPRPGEVGGKHYHFTTVEEMEKEIQHGNFIEHAKFSNNMYGTSKQAVQDVLKNNKICLLDIDEQGVKSIKKTDLDPLCVFIAPPSLKALQNRLNDRGTETAESIERRMATATSALQYSEEKGVYDIIIVNDILEAAYKKLKEFLLQMSFFMELIILMYELIASFFASIVRWLIPVDHKSVSGEVCLITGAGNGIGRLMAIEFAKRRAKVVLWDFDKEGLKETSAMIRELGMDVYSEVCDLSKKDEIKAAAAKVKQEFGEVNILVNNAGVAYCKQLLDLTEHEIENTYKVNVLAHIWTIREFLPSMLERNHGHIVNVASTVGLFASAGMPDYCSSKHAAVGLHNSVFLDLQNAEKYGVKTTLVCPYLIHTGMFNGVHVKYDWILPPINPQDCADIIINAVLTEQNMVAIPGTMYIFHILSTILPTRALIAGYKFVGADKAISYFKPNRPYQVESHAK
ncbi:retinol dehydrogenase 10-B isoform X1 [Ciona intestinalis]